MHARLVEEVRGAALGCAEDLDPGEEVPLRGVGDAVGRTPPVGSRGRTRRRARSRWAAGLRLTVREQILRPGSPPGPGVGDARSRARPEPPKRSVRARSPASRAHEHEPSSSFSSRSPAASTTIAMAIARIELESGSARAGRLRRGRGEMRRVANRQATELPPRNHDGIVLARVRVRPLPW